MTIYYMIQVHRPVQKDWYTMVTDENETECRRLLAHYRSNNEFKRQYRLVRCEIIG